MAAMSWNIEGFTTEKLITLEQYMISQNIDIICMQETHKPNADYYITEAGFLVILSGGDAGQREFAGVGFLISPLLRRSVIGFRQLSSRLCR